MQGKQLMLRFFVVVMMGFAVMAASAGSAWATDLRTAKAAGLIGEQPNGYLGIVSTAGDDVRALVQEINQKRRAAYRKIAAKNGIPLQNVEQMAGKKAMNKTPAGQYIRSSSGQWVKK